MFFDAGNEQFADIAVFSGNIEGIGTFSLSAESKVVEKKTDIRAQSVKVKNINFRSAVSLKKAMTKSKFIREQYK